MAKGMIERYLSQTPDSLIRLSSRPYTPNGNGNAIPKPGKRHNESRGHLNAKLGINLTIVRRVARMRKVFIVKSVA